MTPTTIRDFGLRPILTVGFRQPKTAFFDRILLGLLVIVSRVDLIVFTIFLEAVGVRECCYNGDGNRLEALCSVPSLRATRANPRPSGLVALDLAESRQNYVRGFAISREPSKLQQAWPLLANDIDTARCCHRMIHSASGARNAPR